MVDAQAPGLARMVRACRYLHDAPRGKTCPGTRSRESTLYSKVSSALPEISSIMCMRWWAGPRNRRCWWSSREYLTSGSCLGSGLYKSHRTIDPDALEKSPPRRGGIYTTGKCRFSISG